MKRGFMTGKKSKTPDGSGTSKGLKQGVNESLKALLESVEAPPAAGKRGPGRPVKQRADTAPVILHLYKSQIRWLDDYAVEVQSWHPDNARLSRVEIVRGFLMGLAQYAVDQNLSLQSNAPIKSEQDLQHAMALALGGKKS
jgi:hypothetical protein